MLLYKSVVVAVMVITEFYVNGKFVTTGVDTNKGYTTKGYSSRLADLSIDGLPLMELFLGFP